jgi:hypothetical protein
MGCRSLLRKERLTFLRNDMLDVAPAQEQGISQVKKGELRQKCPRCLRQLLKNQASLVLTK